MFSHVMVGANDIEASKKFYDAVLGVLGAGEPMRDEKEDGTVRLFYPCNGGMFGISTPIDKQPATCGNGSTIGFACDSLEQVKAFHDAGVANGGTSIEDPPGPRQGSMGTLNLAYVRDPAGNKLCALHRAG
ncbi:VOC family protein [Altererythrobacter arenosus]|uniref:VOC family protein n=1 Tax=Altererythrobacter arenosus TaxID=3032592 RepID=A0ABY8FWI8_9SPHN|nr:VOC family protein [Altererythrobacter sp. CAU 1644]WFL78318.1 VOC family protein [Altererythrobacter sp. CAU 1644]